MEIDWSVYISNFDWSKSTDSQVIMWKQNFQISKHGIKFVALWLSVFIPKYSYEIKWTLKYVKVTKYFWIWFYGSASKESTCNMGDLGSIPGLGKSLEEGLATHSNILA